MSATMTLGSTMSCRLGQRKNFGKPLTPLGLEVAVRKVWTGEACDDDGVGFYYMEVVSMGRQTGCEP